MTLTKRISFIQQLPVLTLILHFAFAFCQEKLPLLDPKGKIPHPSMQKGISNSFLILVKNGTGDLISRFFFCDISYPFVSLF